MSEQIFAAELAWLRQKINMVDTQLLALLNERAELSLSVGRLKKQHGQPVFAPEREQLLLEALQAKNTGPLSASQLAAVYQTLFAVSRELQS